MSQPYGTSVCDDVLDELHRCRRLQQSGKFSKTMMQMDSDLEALSVLVEEVGEAGHEVNEAIGKPFDAERQKRLRAELIQVAAMAVGWVLRIDNGPEAGAR